MNAARFLFRWSGRLLRREWRQQLGVLTLIIAGVALSIGAIIAAFNLVEPPASSFGTGNLEAEIFGDIGDVVDALESQGHSYGIVQRIAVRPPGAALPVPVRSQDPANNVTGPLLGLVTGEWPTSADEVGVTDGAPVESRVVGQSIDLGGRERRIVGIVENPTNLNDEFVLTTDVDDFGIEKRFQTAVALVEALPADVTFPAETVAGIADDGGDPSLRTMTAIAVSMVMALTLVVMSLLSAASFAVMARRRARQYGLLAGAGATPRQVRQAVALTGLTTGVLGAAIGTILGTSVTWAVVPRLENAVAHRIDFATPWWTIVPTVLVAIATTTLAAWWPARALSRRPVVEVISALRPQPRKTKGSAAVGLGGAVVGAALLVIGVRSLTATLVAIGLCLATVGLLLLAPALVRLAGVRSKALPLAGRMAGRSIARQQGRSAAFVAALALALAIPVGVAGVTASVDQRNATKAPNLADNMAILWSPGTESDTNIIPSARDTEAIDAAGSALQAISAGAQVAPIQVALDPFNANTVARIPGVGPVPGAHSFYSMTPLDVRLCGSNCNVDSLGDRDANGQEVTVTFRSTWMAHPALLDALGVSAWTSTTEFQPGGVQAISRFDDAMLVAYRNHSDGRDANVGHEPALPANPSIGEVLILPEFAEANGWEVVTVGWLFVNDTPLDAAHVDAVEGAAGADLFVEVPIAPASTVGIRAVAIALGILLALGITVAALALLRAESSADVRLLQAIGAAPGQHRRLSATTAGMLTAMALAIALPIGALAVVTLVGDRTSAFEVVIPWLSIAAVILVLPTLAAAIGWMTSSTHTTNLGRRLT